MAEVQPERDSVYAQNCVAAGTLAGKLRVEKYRTAEQQQAAEVKYEQKESHTGEKKLAAGVHTVVFGIAAVHTGAGSHCVLVEADETAVAGIVALVANPVDPADTAVLVGLAVVAGNYVLDIVGSADTAAQGKLVTIADVFA